MNIGEKIKYVRKCKSITSFDFSSHLGFKSTNAINAIESGKKSPTFDCVKMICDAFDMSMLDLLQVEVPEDFVHSYCRKPPSILGRKIAKARNEMNLSIDQLAESSTVSERQLRMLERGSSKKISSTHALTLARALNVDIEYLLDDDVSI
jgi:transcriptional regulator with XRE-family HTH domain